MLKVKKKNYFNHECFLILFSLNKNLKLLTNTTRKNMIVFRIIKLCANTIMV